MPHAKRRKGPSPAKAKKILREGKVDGKRLTQRQRRFFGAKSKQ